MTAISSVETRPISSYYRPAIMIVGALLILGIFWFTSRYPSLFSKASHLGQHVASMAYTSEVWKTTADTPLWQQVLYSALNWLASMKVGMTFGILFGALLHTVLHYYPMKIGNNLYLNSLKGALVGVPMGVCANCAVPAACGLTRGRGRIEVALGFLFSSPNFNPVVVSMTFTALPLSMSLTKYAILLAMILIIVPSLISWLERNNKMSVVTTPVDNDVYKDAPVVMSNVPEKNDENFISVMGEVLTKYLKNVWILFVPTVTLMVIASIISAILIIFIPWQQLLAEVSIARLALVSLLSVFMPIPIALDVMFATQLQQQGVDAGYVMLFAMTLGTFSIVPATYLWRDVSKTLSVALFSIFVAIGIVLGLVF